MANEPETRWLFGYKKENRDDEEIYIPNKCGHIFDCAERNFSGSTVACPVCGVTYDRTEGTKWTRVRTSSELDNYYTKWEMDSRYVDFALFDEKLNVITDLDAIREGASKGYTALQEHQSAVRYDTGSQSLNETEKENARVNMGYVSATNIDIDNILNS